VGEFLQNYNPTGHVWLSTLAAAGPVVVLLYLLALHPVRRPDGSVHRGIAAHLAAACGVGAALLIAMLVFHMPWRTAGMAMAYGGMYGLFPIGWIVIAAMFLYTITLTNGTFETVKNSVAHLSSDRRVQAILIAFSFGAFVEGAAGFGTPVAISGALMVGLGFRAREAAILCLIANTAPVAYGALGTPITALAKVTAIDPTLISRMAARQLPFFSVIVPVWMTAVQVRMEGGSWRRVWEVWPALSVAGGSFAVTQFLVGNYANYQLVDIAGGVVSMGAVALLCKVWRPREEAEKRNIGLPRGEGHGDVASRVEELIALGKTRGYLTYEELNDKLPDEVVSPEKLDSFLARIDEMGIKLVDENDAPGARGFPVVAATGAPGRPTVPAQAIVKPTFREAVVAWMPWYFLIVLVFVWGLKSVKDWLNERPGAVLSWKVPHLWGKVYRAFPVVKEKTLEKGDFDLAWLSAAGTGIFIAALLAGLTSRMSAAKWREAALRTASRLRLPLLTIVLILGLGYVTKYSGMDAVLGLAFTRTGVMYPFFAAMLGWLGVALTGSDTASNVMFGSMQKITAEQMGLNPVLIVTANSTGGVMGKMIDAQSIVVATAACYEDREQGKMEAGPIFRGVFPHSLALAILMGVLVLLQAYWLRWMIPA
jgi:lactate permease